MQFSVTFNNASQRDPFRKKKKKPLRAFHEDYEQSAFFFFFGRCCLFVVCFVLFYPFFPAMLTKVPADSL